ncbi:uncharacterized protein [Dermacentor albipictus]|uniref:uncharacterized protein n=1 Tax=Dermacentor albipictus TaxID=60249 RepID=UPI0038FC71E8
MATQVGPPIFDEGDDKWDAYQVRLEAFFEAHEIVDPKKRRALLVAALSTKTVDLLAGRCAPNKIQDLTYEAAVQKLAEYFAPKGNEIAESYQFFTRNQQADESTSDFIVELRKMANRCNFGQALERMLRDRLVCGLRDAGVRRNLLARHTLTLQEAEDVALAAEMAARNAQQMGDGPIREGVHAVRTKQERQKFSRRPQPDRMKNSNNEVQTGCLCCGSDTHKTAKCRFRRVECFSCRKRGHLASMCNSKPHQENVAHCEEPSSDSEDYGQFLLHLRESSTGLVRPIWQTLQWKGVPVKMQVDTGSPVSIVTWPTYAQHRHRWPRLDKSSLQLSCFLGRLPVKGQLKVPVTYGGKTANATLVVLGCSGPNLCGRDIIQAFQLTGGSVLNVDVNDGALPRRHSPGQPVWCKDYRAGASWRPGVIQNTRGARLSTVKTEDGELCERHEDQLRHRADPAGASAQAGVCYVGAARKGATLQQTPASARPTKSVAEVVPPAPSAIAVNAASPSQKEGPSTSGLVGTKVSSAQVKPSRQTRRSQERTSSASQEAMDTTSSQTAQQAPKDRRQSQDGGKKDKLRITGPGKVL